MTQCLPFARWCLVFAGLLSPNEEEKTVLLRHCQPWIGIQVSGEWTNDIEQIAVEPLWPRWRPYRIDCRCDGSDRGDLMYVQMDHGEQFGWEWRAYPLWRNAWLKRFEY